MTFQQNHDTLKKAGKASGTFYFKQFKVEDGRSTMKVGTDAVLLGALTNVSNARTILEIGTGSGVIALILAQRSGAMIDAVEIDEESAGQATENARSSNWHERINIIHDSLQDFTTKVSKKYDLIVSNPPFFSCSLKSPYKKRNLSRHDDELSYEELIDCSSQLLAPGASLWVILPVNESEVFTRIALKAGLFPSYRMIIIPKEGRKAHRCIIEFNESVTGSPKEKTLVILDVNGKHTAEYKALTKDFYIDF
jgi:tRNA1Val (adenine37-N6)-methyltransferase